MIWGFILVALIVFFVNYTITVKIGHRYYNVINLYSDKLDAARLLAKINDNMIMFFGILKKKYKVNQIHPNNTEVAKIVDSMITKYDPEYIFETLPIWSSTSYTVGKEKMYLCLRDKKTHKLIDYNTLMFVVLHESAHIANYRTWGHDELFWNIFKFLLIEAVEAGIYSPVRYDKYPVVYCGLTIDYNPYYH